MDEALRAEAGEQALGDPLLEVQVDGVLGEHAGVLEDDRPDRRLAAPVGELLVLLRGALGACRASRPSSGRSRHGGRAAERSRRGRPSSSVVSASGSAPSSSREHESASRNGAASKPVQARDASSRLWQRSICAFRSSWRSRAASSSSSVMRFFSASRSACSISRASRSASRWRMPWPEPALDVVVDHLREAAELLLDRLGLPDEHLEHAVLDALGQHEVVAAHLVGRLELAVDAAVALLDAAGVPGQVEMEEVRAVRLEVQALAGGVGGEQDAQRVLRGVGVEPALDLLAPRAAREAVDHLDALVGAVGALDGLLEDRLQVALRALAVLGEDQDAAVVPLRRWRLSAAGRRAGAPDKGSRGSSRSAAGSWRRAGGATSRRSPASGREAPAPGARALSAVASRGASASAVAVTASIWAVSSASSSSGVHSPRSSSASGAVVKSCGPLIDRHFAVAASAARSPSPTGARPSRGAP